MKPSSQLSAFELTSLFDDYDATRASHTTKLRGAGDRNGDYSCVDCANSTNLSQTFLSLVKKELFFVVVGPDLTRELSRAFCQISCGAACSIPQAAEFPDILK